MLATNAQLHNNSIANQFRSVEMYKVAEYLLKPPNSSRALFQCPLL